MVYSSIKMAPTEASRKENENKVWSNLWDSYNTVWSGLCQCWRT